MVKQMPMLATSVVSERLRRPIARIARGTTSRPTVTRPTRNAASRATVATRGPAARPLPEATPVRIAMRRTAIRSSTIRMPTTSWRSFPVIACSSKALAMIVVLEMAMTAPANKLSRPVQPSKRPIVNPSHTMRLDCSSAVSPAVGPTSASLRRLNSRPRENISRMTPSSDSVCTTTGSATSGIGTWGPTISPAMM